MRKYVDADKFKYSLELSIKSWGRDCNSNAPIINTAYQDVLHRLEATPTANVIEIPEGGIGNLSDGYHTFNELYHHRAILFSVICNSMPDKAWKSKLHDTGDMFDGMFIVGIETPEGQATYHYDIEPYWDMFKVKELEKAPKWDGHTPQVAIDRIAKLAVDAVGVRHGFNVGDFCLYGFSDGNKSLAIVEIVKILDDKEGIAEVKFHKVIQDNTGNGFFHYLFKSGGTMNASFKYLKNITPRMDAERNM